jgi:hypothetical protein
LKGSGQLAGLRCAGDIERLLKAVAGSRILRPSAAADLVDDEVGDREVVEVGID